MSTVPDKPWGKPGLSLNQTLRTITVSSTISYAPPSHPVTAYQALLQPGDILYPITNLNTRKVEVPVPAGGAEYTFMTRALNAIGPSPFSAPAKIYSGPWIPDRAGTPTASQSVQTREITVTVPVTSANGSQVTGYQVRMAKNVNGSWSGYDWIYNCVLATRTYTFTPEFAMQQFRFQGRALTPAGPGPWSINYVQVNGAGSGPHVRVGGSWRRTSTYVVIDGVQRPAVAMICRGGIWRPIRNL